MWNIAFSANQKEAKPHSGHKFGKHSKMSKLDFTVIRCKISWGFQKCEKKLKKMDAVLKYLQFCEKLAEKMEFWVNKTNNLFNKINKNPFLVSKNIKKY